MKYLVIWEQDYDISWVNDIIEEDALDDYIEYYKNQFNNNRITNGNIGQIIETRKSEGEVNYLVDYGVHGKDWGAGFNYSLKEVLSKEDIKNK